MKSIIRFTILFCLLTTQITLINAQSPPPKLNIKDIDKSMALIHDSLYAGIYEMTNVLYRTFVQDLKNTSQTELLKTATPDTNVWREKLEYNEPLVRYYYRHPNFNEYPVVGVSWEAANLFCKWLTDKYNSDPKRKFKKVVFRLPTEKEWELAGYGDHKYLPYAWGGPSLRNSEGRFLCNFRRVGDENISFDTINKKLIVDFKNNPYASYPATELNNASSITENVQTYYPNNFGLYNVCGNVAEMVQEKGIAKGGSWLSPGGDVQVKSRIHYAKPTRYIGFRVFMVVVEK
jgi:formylglycine-generating enzyme required for sulfatase activity